MTGRDFDGAFEALKVILQRFEDRLVRVHDLPDNYYFDTAHVQANGKPLYFGSVRRGRRYVSFHLMPVYVYPDLLEGASEDLLGRMQGKSCFNFKAPDPDVLEELATLTERGFERYREAGYVP